MVVKNHFQDLVSLVSDTDVLNLPSFKPNSFKLDYVKSDDDNKVYTDQKLLNPFANSDTFNADIIHWRRLSTVHPSCKAIYEVTFNITNSNFSFKPGDTIGVIPENNITEVELIINHLELSEVIDLYYVITIDSNLRGAKKPVHVPSKATLRHVLTHCVDLRGILKKAFLLALSRHTKNVSEKKILEYLCSKEGSSAYPKYVLNEHICLLDLFTIFKSCKPPIEVILEHLPRLLPRPYSIINSALNDANVLKICFSVLELCNNRRGLTTDWLEKSLSSNDNISMLEERLKLLSLKNDTSKIPIYMRKNISEFRLPKDLRSPIIMIGPGCGVAPFIGFLEEREFLHKNCKSELGFSWLFFGCRDPKLDYIYETELKGFVENGVLNKISTAFSRLENAEYHYVQDALVKNGEEITKLILDGAYVYVCGDLNTMAKDIKDAITRCIELHGEKTSEEAETIVKDMISEKRYLVDAWS